MSKSSFVLKMSEHGRGEVFLDGEKVSGVTAATVKVGVDAPNEVCLTLIPKTIEIEGTFDVSTIESDARGLRVVP